ncbi:zinc finger BED domain-containing 1-like [Brachionus plicatilis]|uniref:Zinc finger BED domain-containing 1-like n=1 Tax=Brachionus plicatilis TaxID=10195 RepID=A0A3M7PU14_BRAPC|nr:zinc finger BED domain-containing 1-like [Brachionus plicatilis]
MCSAKLKKNGNTSVMLNHLRSVHSLNLEKVSKTSTNDNLTQMPIKSLLSNEKVYDENTRKYQKLTDSVVDFVTHCSEALSLVDNLSRRKLTDVIISEKFETHKKKIVEELDQTLALSVTTDCWTSPANDPYMGLTCHYIDNEDQLQKIPIALKYVPESHTSQNLASSLKKVFHDYNIEHKLTSISTDSAANMIKMATFLSGKKHLPFLGHIMNIVVKKNIIDSSNESLKTLISKCRKLVGTFRHVRI